MQARVALRMMRGFPARQAIILGDRRGRVGEVERERGPHTFGRTWHPTPRRPRNARRPEAQEPTNTTPFYCALSERMAPGGCAPVRLFVGGVDASVSVAELAGRFASFGAVAGVEEAPCKLPGGGVDKRARNFFLNLAPNTDKELQRCLATVRPTAQSASVLTPPPQYNGCVWRGSRLHIGRASEHFTARLKREWSAAAAARAAEAAAAAVKAASAAQLLSPLALSTARRELEERLQATKLRLRAGNEVREPLRLSGNTHPQCSFSR